MPDDDAFEIAFTWPEEGAEHDADAAEWLERFADQLAQADHVRIEITGSYHRNPPDPDDPDDPDQSDDDSEGRGGVPVVYVRLCPGKHA